MQDKIAMQSREALVYKAVKWRLLLRGGSSGGSASTRVGRSGGVLKDGKEGGKEERHGGRDWQGAGRQRRAHRASLR